MDKDIGIIAGQFSVYAKLGWLDRWDFRRHIAWLGDDSVALGYLLDLERELQKKSLSIYKISTSIEETLSWYHNEAQNNSLSRAELSGLLHILTTFYSKNGHLHRSYRELIFNILKAEDNFKKHRKSAQGITPEEFRFEVAKSISNLNTDWSKAGKAYLKSGSDYLLRYLTNIACNVNNLQMFTLFQEEAEKVIARYGLWDLGERLHPLETIARKVRDIQTFEVVIQDFVPVFGLNSTSSLLAKSKDFYEFKEYYQQIQEQIRWWGNDYISLFNRTKDISEVGRLLKFLRILANHARMTKYIKYTLAQPPGALFPYISLNQHKSDVFQWCLQQDWQIEVGYGQDMGSLIDQFEQTIVNRYLITVWHSVFLPRKLHWEFTTFTDYIPYEMRTLNWANDNDKMRPYWNSGEIERRECKHFLDTLEPLLLSIFRQLNFSDNEILFAILPKYLSIQEFTKSVKIPVEWKKGIEYQEGYDKYAGNYTAEVEVARPISFIDHIFTFERPYLENAINLLTTKGKVHEAIQAFRKSQV